MKILIVEDSPTQSEKLKFLLEQNGFQVDAAVNGQDALDKLEKVNPDLLISDIMMPEMNGYELCRHIRQHPRYNNISLILLSTLSEVEDIVSALESGANFILNKPYTDDYLLQHLHGAINIAKIRQTETDDGEVKILINQKAHIINTKKSQILDFLLSIYDTAVFKNKELYNTRMQLEELNNELEKKIEERTRALFIESEERKRYELQFMESQKLESIGKLTGGIAHDFNNLLLIALGNLEMLSTGLQPESEQMHHLKQAYSVLKLGTSLTRHLLSFARKQTLFPKSINVRDYLEEISSLIKPALGDQITLTASYADNLWPIWVDPVQFENAIMNLSINARDAMDRRGKIHFQLINVLIDEGVAKFEDLKSGDYVKISITDTGSGMPPEVVQHIFEPFYTTKKAGSGTGLGLSMVYGFIKQSNGAIQVESEPGNGTTFHLYLPRSTMPVEHITETKSAIPAPAGGCESILIVEDEAPLLKLVASYLQKLGYQVTTAASGEEGLAIIKSGRHIDLLLTDISLTGDIMGPQLAVEAKKILPLMPVLFTSGYSRDELSKHKLELEETNHLMKPYKLDELAARLKQLLNKNR